MLATIVLCACLSGPSYHQYEAESLVAAMADDDFDKREAAYVALERMGCRVRKHLKIGLSHADVEVRVRCRRLLDVLDVAEFKRAAKLIDDNFKDFPYIDALCYDVASHQYTSRGPFRVLVDRYHTSYAVGCPADFRPYATYRAATRLMSIDMAINGIPLPVIRCVHWVMWDRDRYYLSRNGMQWVQPDWWPFPPPKRR